MSDWEPYFSTPPKSSLEEDWRNCLRKQPEIWAEQYLHHVGRAHIQAAVELINMQKYSLDELLTCDIPEIRTIAKALLEVRDRNATKS